MLGLSRNVANISVSMITTSETITGFEVVQVLGIVEGIVEKSFRAVAVGGIGLVEGGELDNMLFDAKEALLQVASDRGANAVIALRYAITSRDLEKSVVAYGTAVKCRRKPSDTRPSVENAF